MKMISKPGDLYMRSIIHYATFFVTGQIKKKKNRIPDAYVSVDGSRQIVSAVWERENRVNDITCTVLYY